MPGRVSIQITMDAQPFERALGKCRAAIDELQATTMLERWEERNDGRDLWRLYNWADRPPPRAIDATLLEDAIADGLATFGGLTDLGREVVELAKAKEAQRVPLST